MPRQPRYFLPDYAQHVILRGVNKQPTFFEADDYRLFLKTLAGGADRYDCRVHAYVLMTNHVHLLLTPEDKRSIPCLVQAIGRGYVQSVNRKYGRTGTLWQGRYKACLVEDDEYFLACQRYIELNPVRAGMVADPAEYPFSSYGCNALGWPNSLVTPHPTYLGLGRQPAERHAAYCQMFAEAGDAALLDKIRSTTNACRVLGSERFKDKIEALTGQSVRPATMGRPCGLRQPAKSGSTPVT